MTVASGRKLDRSTVMVSPSSIASAFETSMVSPLWPSPWSADAGPPAMTSANTTRTKVQCDFAKHCSSLVRPLGCSAVRLERNAVPVNETAFRFWVITLVKDADRARPVGHAATLSSSSCIDHKRVDHRSLQYVVTCGVLRLPRVTAI